MAGRTGEVSDAEGNRANVEREEVTPGDVTCWSLIHAAAAGDPSARNTFSRLYEPVARTYLNARWANGPLRSKRDDAVQDLFVECFKADGVLDRITTRQPDGFRAFFHGVLRNIARRYESVQTSEPLPDDLPNAGSSLGKAFDRAWAQAMMKEAARVMAERAATAGERAVKRVELLRLRFQENRPIRMIAEELGVDAGWLHHEYATARSEFQQSLREVMRFQSPNGTDRELDQACLDLLTLLH